MSGKSILYISSELYPYFPESSLSKKSLLGPKQMLKNQNDVRVFIPRFGFINERRFQLHEVIRLSGMNLVINDIDQPLIIKVASIPGEKIQAYFIDNDEYFKRKNLFTDEDDVFCKDNDERAIFFARGVLETIKKLNWKPDIIHVHGWMASLVPLYLKRFYGNDTFFSDTTIAVSLFNDGFEEKMDNNFINKLAFDNFSTEDIAPLEEPTYANLIRVALMHADVIIKGEEVLSESITQILSTIENIKIHESCEETEIFESYDSIYEEMVTTSSIS